MRLAKQQTRVDTLALHIQAICNLLGVPEPEREYRFHPTRKWRADFAFPNYRLLVEYEGGIFERFRRRGFQPAGGWHQAVSGMLDDMDKYNQAALLGWRLFRFSAKHVDSGEAQNLIQQYLEGYHE